MRGLPSKLHSFPAIEMLVFGTSRLRFQAFRTDDEQPGTGFAVERFYPD